jgi:hypothetical protein
VRRSSTLPPISQAATSSSRWSPGPPTSDPAALADAPAYVALILATRYLIDHLEGDVHFKVERRGDNLTRASGQLAMLASMRTARSRMLETAERALEARHPRSD